jgi:hypothetical protein
MDIKEIVRGERKSSLKKFLISACLLTIVTACSNQPKPFTDKFRDKHNTDVIVEKKVHMMHRQEVINAIEDCKTANLRPVLFYSTRYVNDRPVPMIADITCAPRSGY